MIPPPAPTQKKEKKRNREGGGVRKGGKDCNLNLCKVVSWETTTTTTTAGVIIGKQVASSPDSLIIYFRIINFKTDWNTKKSPKS